MSIPTIDFKKLESRRKKKKKKESKPRSEVYYNHAQGMMICTGILVLPTIICFVFAGIFFAEDQDIIDVFEAEDSTTGYGPVVVFSVVGIILLFFVLLSLLEALHMNTRAAIAAQKEEDQRANQTDAKKDEPQEQQPA